MIYHRLHRRILWSWGTQYDDPDVALDSLKGVTLKYYSMMTPSQRNAMISRDFNAPEALYLYWYEEYNQWVPIYQCTDWDTMLKVPNERLPLTDLSLSLEERNSPPYLSHLEPYLGAYIPNDSIFYAEYRFKEGATNPEAFGTWAFGCCVIKDFEIYHGIVPPPSTNIIPQVTAFLMLSGFMALGSVGLNVPSGRLRASKQ